MKKEAIIISAVAFIIVAACAGFLFFHYLWPEHAISIFQPARNASAMPYANGSDAGQPDPDEGFYEQAIAKRNVSLCSGISDQIMKKMCQNLTNELSASMTAAFVSGDASDCSSIEDPAARQQCESSLSSFSNEQGKVPSQNDAENYEESQTSGDPLYCQFIENKTLQDLCYNKLT
jgi:hypothetical protein